MTDSKQQVDPTWDYGFLTLLSCALVSFLLYSRGASIVCAAPILLCAVALVMRRSFLLFVLPYVVMVTICVTVLSDRLQFSAMRGSALAISAFVAVAVSSRLHGMLFPTSRRVLTQHVVYSVPPVSRSRQRAASHVVSLVFMAIAWWFAGYLNSDFAMAVNSSQFQEYRIWTSESFRMVPWAYCGIKIVIVLATLFSVAYGLLSYLQCRSDSGMMAAMLLRHELWRWNGKEQRMIAKALKHRD